VSKWAVKTYDWVIDVIPLDDLKEHLMADECWCAPKRSQLPELLCSDGQWRAQLLFTHNAADRRELKERKREALIKDVRGKLGGK
jgi:hypothetical protein